MQTDDLKWRRFFGGVLVGGPTIVAVIVTLITGNPGALLLSAIIFLVPMSLGAWLLLSRPNRGQDRP
jgi:hypothetical protein